MTLQCSEKGFYSKSQDIQHRPCIEYRPNINLHRPNIKLNTPSIEYRPNIILHRPKIKLEITYKNNLTA